MGEWQIRVSDQEKEDARGKFLGWSLTLFGSALDPALTTPYEVDPQATVLAEYPFRTPHSTSPSTAKPSVTEDEEAHLSPSSSSAAQPALTQQQGWMLVGLMALAVAAVVSLTVFLAKRRQRVGASYSTLATEDVDMGTMESS